LQIDVMQSYADTLPVAEPPDAHKRAEQRMVKAVLDIVQDWKRDHPEEAGQRGIDRLRQRLDTTGVLSSSPLPLKAAAALDVCSSIGQVLQALKPKAAGVVEEADSSWSAFDFDPDKGPARRLLLAIVARDQEHSSLRARSEVCQAPVTSVSRQHAKTGVARKTRSDKTPIATRTHTVDFFEAFSVESPHPNDVIYIFADGKKTLKQIRWMLRNLTNLFQIYCLAFKPSVRVGKTVFGDIFQECRWLRARPVTECDCPLCWNSASGWKTFWRITTAVHRPPSLDRPTLRHHPASSRKPSSKPHPQPALTPAIAEDIKSIPTHLRPTDGMMHAADEDKDDDTLNYCTNPACLNSPVRNFSSKGPRTQPNMHDLFKYAFCEGFSEGRKTACHRAECKECPFRRGCAAEPEASTDSTCPFPRCALEHSETRYVKFDVMNSRSQPGQSGKSITVIEPQYRTYAEFFRWFAGQLELAGPHVFIDRNNKTERTLALERIRDEKSRTTVHVWVDFPSVHSLKSRASPTSAKFARVHNMTAVVTYFDQEHDRLQSVTYYCVDPHTNDHFFVHGAFAKLIDEIRSTIVPALKLVLIHSDGASKHFRSRFLYYLIVKLSLQYDVDIIWYYNAPGEGKGPPDEEGGLPKVLYKLHIKSGYTVSGFEEYVQWLESLEHLDPQRDYDASKFFQIMKRTILHDFPIPESAFEV
jgi:hypothetical protein